MTKPKQTQRSQERTHRRGDIEEKVHDAYQPLKKPKEPVVCPDCHAVYSDGRWQWMATPADAAALPCPSCQRIHDRFPAGYLELGGDYFTEHKDEILNLVRNDAEHALREHPLQKIVEIEDHGTEVSITTAELHLARKLGETVQHAHKGDLDVRYSPDQTQVRMKWRR
jgi:NMD protein affecting ribosome stability and mRNA decay